MKKYRFWLILGLALVVGLLCYFRKDLAAVYLAYQWEHADTPEAELAVAGQINRWADEGTSCSYWLHGEDQNGNWIQLPSAGPVHTLVLFWDNGIGVKKCLLDPRSLEILMRE
jgi:hypothetical protein